LLLGPAGGVMPDMAIDNQGRTHVVWRGNDFYVWYAQVAPDGAILLPARKVYDFAKTAFPRLAVDANGDAHIVTTTTSVPSTLIYLKVSNGARVLLKAFTMFTPGVFDSEADYSPSIDVNPLNGLPVIAAEVELTWQSLVGGYPVYYYNEEISVISLDAEGAPIHSSRWSAYYLRNSTAPGYRAQYPEVAVDSQGAAHCTWLHSEPGWPGQSVGYARAGAGVWVEIANNRNVSGTTGRPRIVRSEPGFLEIAWSTTGGTVVRQEMDNLGFTEVDDTVVSQAGAQPSRPRISFGNGAVYFGWADAREGGGMQIYARNILSATAERNVTCSPVSAFNHAVAARGNHSFDVAWQDSRSGASQIYYRNISLPRTMSMHRADSFAVANGGPGTGIDAPLELKGDANALGVSSIVPISQGLVADGVTPLLIKLTELEATAGESRYRITLAEPTGGTVVGGLGSHLRVLQAGAFVAAGSDGTVTLTIPAHISPTADAFAYVSGIRAEDLILSAGEQQLCCSLSAQPIDGSGSPLGGGITLPFKIAKPPIVLIHGFNSDGRWGEDFKHALYATRRTDFVYELHYGIDPFTGDNHENTYGALIPLVGVLDSALHDDVEGDSLSSGRWEFDWAMTRYDVVAHSQGGVLTRLLCAQASPWGPGVTAFRNSANFYRGRFHRIVTIGSPQNGTSLLRYLLQLRENNVGFIPGFVLPKFADNLYQAKFDPWGEQIAQINRSGCEIDPGAKFHAIRAQVTATVPAFLALFLDRINTEPGPSFGKTGQQIVLPDGSDTIVDMASQRVNAATPGSLFDSADVAHAPVRALGLDQFGTPNGETTYVPLGRYAANLLDGAYVAGGPGSFGSFLLPSAASPIWRDEIDSFVQYLKNNSYDDPNLIRPYPVSSQQSLLFRYVLKPSVSGDPIAGNVNWFAEAFGPYGVTTDGLALQVDPASPARADLSVEDSLVGDVVLYANYTSASGKIVVGRPVVVTSRPAGTVVTNVMLVPARATLATGDSIILEAWAQYSGGTRSRLCLMSSNLVELTSSNPGVVGVGPGMVLRALSPGKSTITAVYCGFTANAMLTVSPTLCFVEAHAIPSGGGAFNGGGFYPAGASATVTAVANRGFSFVNWTEAGVVVSSSSNYTFDVTAGRTLAAQFAPDSPMLCFGSPVWDNGVLNLTVQGPLGANFEVQASTNLWTWMPVTNFVLAAPSISFSVPTKTNINRTFYRAVSH
jgi:hypothetical protein